MSPLGQPTFINPTPLKNQFAHRFLWALKNINNTKRSSADSNQIYRRSRSVKIAAYAAMASVVGSRRAWSREVLRKIRKRSRNTRKWVDHKITHRHAKKSVRRRNPNPKREDIVDPFLYSDQESKLRKLVPGAETMDSCGLMDETADYIKCLTAQVEVMRTILDLYTTT